MWKLWVCSCSKDNISLSWVRVILGWCTCSSVSDTHLLWLFLCPRIFTKSRLIPECRKGENTHQETNVFRLQIIFVVKEDKRISWLVVTCWPVSNIAWIMMSWIKTLLFQQITIKVALEEWRMDGAPEPSFIKDLWLTNQWTVPVTK